MLPIILLSAAICIDCPNFLNVQSTAKLSTSQFCGANEKIVLMRLTIKSLDNPFMLNVYGGDFVNLVPPEMQIPMMSVKLNGLGVFMTYMQLTVNLTGPANVKYGLEWACLSTLTNNWIPNYWSDSCYPTMSGCFSNRSSTCYSNYGPADPSTCKGTQPATYQLCDCNSWSTGTWNQCANCTRNRVVNCVDADNNVVNDNLCTGTKPLNTMTCTESCPSNWVIGEWSKCNSCWQTRMISCVDAIGNTRYDCPMTPSTEQKCDCPSSELNSGIIATITVVGFVILLIGGHVYCKKRKSKEPPDEEYQALA